MLQTLSSSQAGLLFLILTRWLKPAGATTAQHLCTIHFAIDAMAAVTLFLPATAVGKLQPSVVASLANTNELLASGSCSTKRTDAAETVDLVHTGGAVGTG